MTRISSGSDVMNSLINGGYEKDTVTTIYGPAGVGKTCLCVQAMIQVLKIGKKVIYVDTEGGFCLDRMKQIEEGYKLLLDNLVMYKPTSFKEQMEAFDKMRLVVKENLGMIIIDSIAMLYRLELGKGTEVYNVNRELGRQISFLTEIARKHNVPILITNQVYSSFDERGKVNMVGGDILKYWSKCLIELKLDDGKRIAVIKKHRSIAEGNQVCFVIKEEGVVEAKEFEEAQESSSNPDEGYVEIKDTYIKN